MSATSVTGQGVGEAGKITMRELSILANGPAIFYTDTVEIADVGSSPPSASNFVVFPAPLPNGADNYVVILTTQNAGSAYVTSMDENDDGDFIGFHLVGDTDGTVMYLVASKGSRPLI